MTMIRNLISTTMLAALAVLCGGPVLMSQGSVATIWERTIGSDIVTLTKHWVDNPNDGHYTVQIQHTGDGTTFEIPLSASVGRFSGAWVWQRRLLIFVDDEASVVDVESRTLADQFLADRPSVSPNNRFVVYRRFVPRYAENDEGVYLLYDMSKSAAENRMSGSSDDGIALEQNAGTAVFPQWNASRLAYGGRKAEGNERFHELRSTLTWIDTNSFVFVDWSRPVVAGPHTSSVVRIDIGSGPRDVRARIQRIDATQVIDASRKDNPPSYAADALYANGIEVLACTRRSCRLRIAVSGTPGKRVSSFEVEI